MDDEWSDDDFDEFDGDADGDDPIACPECGADVHTDAEACPACGYWMTEADRTAAWRAGSASGRIITIGLWMLAAAAAAVVLNTLLG